MLLGCGARSALSVEGDGGVEAADAGRRFVDAGPPMRIDGGRRDSGSPDSGFRDAGMRDAGMPDAGPAAIAVACVPAVVTTRPREGVRLTADIVAERPSRGRWVIAETPDGAAPELDAPGLDATFTPDLEGLYVLRFEANDDVGNRASCTTEVVANNGEPAVRCPEDVEILRGTSVDLLASAADDDGIASWEWSVLSTTAPDEGVYRLFPGDTELATFQVGDVFEAAGTYSLQVRVVDTDGARARCRFDVRVLTPPQIECPGPIEAPTRQPLRVELEVRDDREIVADEWRLDARPAESVAELEDVGGPFFTLTPDRQGDYVAHYEVFDDDGLMSVCDVLVIGTPTPPELTCPDEVATNPLLETEITVEAVDDGDTLTYSWDLSGRPDGSDAMDPSPAAPTARFTPDVAGAYVATVTVRDEDGMEDTCDVLVSAFADEGLRVEMSWNTGGSSDMDLHLLDPAATRWFDDDRDGPGTNLDCYYRTCIPTRDYVVEWGDPGSDEDDPRLDIDDTNGFGPENINVDDPAPGTYRIGVHAFNGSPTVTVRIYCGGTRIEPREVLEAAVSDNRAAGSSDRSGFWRVADVSITAGGACTITPLLDDGGDPDVRTRGSAEDER